MFKILLTFLIIISLLSAKSFLGNIFGNNVIMEPLASKSGDAACLVFIQGAKCPQESYVDHLKAI